MKNYGKIALFCALIFIFAASPAFSQLTLGDLQKQVGDFSSKIAQSMPFNSTMGLNWSDAYIGQLIDLPPHFGIGLSTGFTTLNIGSINGLMKMFGEELPVNLPAGFPLLGYTVEVRIGGFLLPFDIGAKFGYMDLSIRDLLGVDIKYMLFGGDVRYALIKGDALPLKLSIGVGFNHLSGGISKTLPLGQSFNFNSGSTTYRLSMTDPDLGLKWETNCLELKAHISFPLIVITPYAGFGFSYSWSKAGYEVKSDISAWNNTTQVPLNNVKDAIKSFGIDNINENGFGRMIEVEAFNIRAFGGFSINIAVFRLDLTGMYNFMDSSFGITTGLRFQF